MKDFTGQMVLTIGGVLMISFLIGLGITGFGITMGDNEARHQLHTEAIERGYGLYCPTNGQFAWAGECKDSEQ